MNPDRLAGVLARGRDHANALMQDSCTITIPGEGEGTYDPGTNTTIPPDPTVIYDGRCRIQLSQPVSDRPLVAVDQKTVVSHVISIPVGSPTVPRMALITITASTHDPANIGRQFTVRSRLSKTHATAERLQADELQLEAP
ncbi:DUF6093 family protein [Nakamurella lactea]|uniref:DUF6093 family protein n=1 Tax=Nakamurella lactea TaxID=459515 RepID=UPI0003FF5252|nr:DUF6093 family protein [Nakamurella lactea]